MSDWAGATVSAGHNRGEYSVPPRTPAGHHSPEPPFTTLIGRYPDCLKYRVSPGRPQATPTAVRKPQHGSIFAHKSCHMSADSLLRWTESVRYAESMQLWVVLQRIDNPRHGCGAQEKK